MKKVSFEVAKAIKNAGYPQNQTDSHYAKGGELVCYGIAGETGFDTPTYLDVWLWLWREKGIYIQVEKNRCILSFMWGDSCTFKINPEPEETIEKVIEYLIDNNLIK